MRRPNKKFANPFYGLLLAAGIAFALTAGVYCVMVVRQTRAATLTTMESSAEHPLMEWMDRHGNATLIGELALLAVFTFAAIGTDEYWQRRAANQRIKP